MQLSPISTRAFQRTSNSSYIEQSARLTQRCPSLSTGQCCVPVDISEVSLTTHRQHYNPTALEFQLIHPLSGTEEGINVWTKRDCVGHEAAQVPLVPGRRGSNSYDVKEGVRVSGVGTTEAQEEREVIYPSSMTYQGGLYYEYLGGSLVYAKVSLWGEGPNIIYGMRQTRWGIAATGTHNRTIILNETTPSLQMAGTPTKPTGVDNVR